jgi:hypothetical protein
VSASEKLKALDEAFDTPRFLGTLNYYIGPGARTAVSRESEKMYFDVKAVLVALPQIVAVVEAAERLQRDPRVIVADVDLRAALAALEQALSDG